MKTVVGKGGWPCSGGRRDFLQVPHSDCIPPLPLPMKTDFAFSCLHLFFYLLTGVSYHPSPYTIPFLLGALALACLLPGTIPLAGPDLELVTLAE